jgi:hypothetical protein
MNFIVKKTNELTQIEKQQICDLFLDVFKKEKSLKDFEKQFLNTTKGYSYHSLMIDNEIVVGINTLIPYDYIYFEKEVLIVLSVDTMTKEKYRALPNFTKMARMVYEEAKNDGVCFVLGFPNDISYKIFKKMLKWKDIGRLNFYILPINIGSIKKSLFLLSPLSYIFSKMINILPLFRKKNIHNIQNSIYKLNNQKFKIQRYSDKEHKVIKNEDYEFIYKLDNHENINIAYILDVIPLNKYTLEKATMQLINKYNFKIDSIIYIGNIDFKPINIFEVPLKFEPKNIYVSGLILNDEIIDDRIWSLNNWNLNLSNMDVL